jgi:hypothetical protein
MEARDLRVSDAEREHVGELLQRAVGQGMLSLGEFTERMDTALAAKTRGELNAVLVDLPGIQLISEFVPPPYPDRPYAARPVPPSPAPAPSVGHHVSVPPPGEVIRGRMSSVTRTGSWSVPASLKVDTRVSSVNLDFTRAVMATQVVYLDVDDYASSLTLIVPAEATVDLNGIETVGGGATNKVRSGPPIGPLHLVVRGKVRFGTVTARHPFGTSLRNMFQ